MVVSPLRKPLDDAFMQPINGRALSCDFCPQIASVLQGRKYKTLAGSCNAAGTPSMLLSASGAQDHTTGMNRTAVQEDPVQVNAAGYDKTASRSSEGPGTAHRGGGKPSQGGLYDLSNWWLAS
ncbi:hypothetical protein WJX77_000827 [Trebouxia sp. C0004]